MKVSISKSVARAFEVLEVFRTTPTPLTASEVRRRLDCPHSSGVAVLQNLTDLGYLSYDASTRRYFPTRKLAWLGSLTQQAARKSGQLSKIADLIARGTGQTTVITSRMSIFLNVNLVCPGTSAKAASVTQGVGLPLGRTVPGLAILSQLADDKVAETIAATNRWSEKTRTDYICDITHVMRGVSSVRSGGAALGFEPTGSRDQVIAYPFASPYDGSPLAVSVVGGAEVITPRINAIRQVMEHHLQALPCPAMPAALNPPQAAAPHRFAGFTIGAARSPRLAMVMQPSG